MAGSKAAGVYNSDDGKKYLVRLDKSNMLATGFQLAVSADASLSPLPQGVKMRYLNCLSATGIQRKVFVSKVTDPTWTGTTAPTVTLPTWNSATNVGTQTVFTITSRIGEKRSTFSTSDTGQTDP